jgi:hypothetical protein
MVCEANNFSALAGRTIWMGPDALYICYGVELQKYFGLKWQ